MTVEYFEGPAGSGKTYNLIERVRKLVGEKILGDGQRVLALTFMNGARRRLEANLGKFPELRRRFECKTVDAFAQTIIARRRSLLSDCAKEIEEEARKLDQFNSKCFLAAHLVRSESVAEWVAASFPLVIVDEAQDLNTHRLPILQGLSSACAILAAADEFQCLDDGVDSSAVISWLGSYPNAVKLNGSTQSGILDVAQAVRNGEDILPLLVKDAKYAVWKAPGFTLIETPGTWQFIAWHISNQLNKWKDKGNVAILTAHKDSPVVRKALGRVHSEPLTYRSGGSCGPFPMEWVLDEKERAADLCKQLELPDLCVVQNVKSANTGSLNDPALVRVRARMERTSRISGERTFSNAVVMEMVADAVRDVARFGGRRGTMRAVMSIHRAKNQEFRNVIILWPLSVKGTADQKRRLLYNAITRAQMNCTVVVFGEGRLTAAPFGTAESNPVEADDEMTEPGIAKAKRRRRRTRRASEIGGTS